MEYKNYILSRCVLNNVFCLKYRNRVASNKNIFYTSYLSWLEEIMLGEVLLVAWIFVV